MILMNKWFSEFLTLKTKYFNDLIFWWFYWFSQNFSSKLFDKVQFFVFTLNTKYLQNNFRQSSRNAKFFKFDFLQRIDTKLNFVQVEISKNVDLKIIFNAMNHNGLWLCLVLLIKHQALTNIEKFLNNKQPK